MKNDIVSPADRAEIILSSNESFEEIKMDDIQPTNLPDIPRATVDVDVESGFEVIDEQVSEIPNANKSKTKKSKN